MSKFPFDFEEYKNALGQKESSDRWNIVNRLGYAGRYQMGAAALIDAGLVKPGTTNAGLKNPSNWTRGLSLRKFLSTPSLQDKALEKYTYRNYTSLRNNDVIPEGSSPAHIAGYVAGSHLVGATDARKSFLFGKDAKDANNQTPQDYFKLIGGKLGLSPEQINQSISTERPLQQPSLPSQAVRPPQQQPRIESPDLTLTEEELTATPPSMFDDLKNKWLRGADNIMNMFR